MDRRGFFKGLAGAIAGLLGLKYGNFEPEPDKRLANVDSDSDWAKQTLTWTNFEQTWKSLSDADANVTRYYFYITTPDGAWRLYELQHNGSAVAGGSGVCSGFGHTGL